MLEIARGIGVGEGQTKDPAHPQERTQTRTHNESRQEPEY